MNNGIFDYFESAVAWLLFSLSLALSLYLSLSLSLSLSPFLFSTGAFPINSCLRIEFKFRGKYFALPEVSRAVRVRLFYLFGQSM